MPTHYEQNYKGETTKGVNKGYIRSELLTLAVAATVIGILIYGIGRVYAGGVSKPDPGFVQRGGRMEESRRGRPREILGTPCKKVAAQSFDCSTPEARLAWKKYEKSKTIKVIVTFYSAYETCKESKAENCINAMGYRPISGKSVACPRRYKLGTRISIKGHSYTCDDRTAIRYDGRFDIYTDNYSFAKKGGRHIQEVTILN